MSCLKVYTLFATLFYSVLFVNAQAATPWLDTVTSISFLSYSDKASNVTWGFIFPKSNTPTNEFLGIVTAPKSLGWLGVDLGPTMADNLLLVTWLNGNTPIVSPRHCSNYTLPKVYEGPKITLLSTSGVSGANQRYVYRCQNCTAWTGGGVTLGKDSQFAFAVSTANVTTPSDPGSTFKRHTSVGVYDIDLSSPNATSSNYDAYIAKLSGPSASPTGGYVSTLAPRATPI